MSMDQFSIKLHNKPKCWGSMLKKNTKNDNSRFQRRRLSISRVQTKFSIILRSCYQNGNQLFAQQTQYLMCHLRIS